VYSARCFSPILMKRYSRQIFENNSNIHFDENPFGGSRSVPCGQTDRRTDMTKLMVSFETFRMRLKDKTLTVNLLSLFHLVCLLSNTESTFNCKQGTLS
jgi:hypothetical protein